MTVRNDHYTTNDASFLQVESNYDFWSAVQYVNPFIMILQQIQYMEYAICMLIGLEKVHIQSIYKETTRGKNFSVKIKVMYGRTRKKYRNKAGMKTP